MAIFQAFNVSAHDEEEQQLIDDRRVLNYGNNLFPCRGRCIFFCLIQIYSPSPTYASVSR